MTSNHPSTDTAQANRVATEFGIDRDAIQNTMQRVQAGEISPAEATRFLLSARTPQTLEHQPVTNTTSGESLADLIQRLGTPPADIVDRWCVQMRVAAVVHRARTGQSLPPIDRYQWSLQSSGDLWWNGRSFSDQADAVDVNQVDAQSKSHIQAFRDSLIGPANHDAAVPKNSDHTTADRHRATTVHRNSKRAQHQQKNPAVRRVVVSGLIGVGCLAMLGILYQASPNTTTNNQSVTDSKPNLFDPAADSGVASELAPDSISTDPIDAELPDANALEVLEDSVSETDSDRVLIDDPALIKQEDFLSLDSIMPAAQGFTSSDATAEPSDPETARSTVAEDTSATADAIIDDETESPEEAPQTTRTSSVMSVLLPATSQIDQRVELRPTAINDCQLEFPFPVALQLRRQDTIQEIMDAGSEAVIARIEGDSTGTNIAWTAISSKHSRSNLLVHGRLKVDDGDIVYLRPTVEADSWPLDMQRSDVRPTWDLTAPIPPRVTRLSADFQLPDEIEIGWIEPIDSSSPRRAQGVAVLTSKENESVSLGVRLDIRCSRKLSCRVRYAARISADAPWQIVSRPMLEQSADNLVNQSEFISEQIAHMAATYSRADTDQRRVLRPRRDALDERSATLQKVADSLAELRSLIAQIEGVASLNLRVWVEWPDGEQTLFETKAKQD